MNHHATPAFWECHRRFPAYIRELADRNFRLLKEAPRHPSLHFKKVGRFCSVRVGRKYRALGVETPDRVVWFWIGTHGDYDKLIAGM